MYSVVLLMALSGGAETPAHCRGCSCSCGCFGGGGGMFGCHGCRGCHGCFGCHGCHGGYSCGGCYGGGYGCHGYASCGGCYGGGCYGGGCYGGGCYGCGGYAAAPVHVMPAVPAAPPKEMPPKTSNLPAPATIIVSLPSDAKLSIDDHVTSSTSSTRVLTSPALQLGKEFHYTLKGEITREGKSVEASKVITVRAGQETRVTLDFPVASVAQR